MHKLTISLLATATLFGCLDVDTSSDSQDLSIGGLGGAYPATIMSAYAATTDGVSVSWTEHGGNGTTVLQRLTYNLDGSLNGGWADIASWSNTPAGPNTYFDWSHPVIKSRLVIGGPLVFFGPDTQVDYRIVELPIGVTTCVGQRVGICAYTSTTAYMPKSTVYSPGRIQLEIKTAQATANANNTYLHVRAKVNNYNETWLASTRNDFSVGSYLPYDLSTSYVSGLQDIETIDLWTPDPDGICVGEVTLIIDGAAAFDQQFPSCVWVKNGSSLHVPFATMRSSALWRSYAPDSYLGKTPPRTFVGFHSDGLIADVDSIMESNLRNPYATTSAGPYAHLGHATTISRGDAMHMHVLQHISGIHVVWNNIDFGLINADPTYDLVIHNHDNTCAGWCVKAENFNANSGYSAGVTQWLIDHLNPLAALIEYEVNDQLTNAFNKQNPTGLLDPGVGASFCFPDPSLTATLQNPKAIVDRTDLAKPVSWDSGSLTVCGPYSP